MRSSAGTEFYHNRPKPFLKKKKSPKKSEYSFVLVPILRKKNCIKLCYGTETVFQRFKSPAFWPGCCWERNCTLQNENTWSSFTLGEVSVHLAPSTAVTAAAVLQVLTLTSTSSLEFVIWGPPDLLVTRRWLCVPLPKACELSPSIHCQALLSPCLSLTYFFTTHNTHHTSQHCRCRQKMHHLPRAINLLQEIPPCKSRGRSAAFREFHLLATPLGMSPAENLQRKILTIPASKTGRCWTAFLYSHTRVHHPKGAAKPSSIVDTKQKQL